MARTNGQVTRRTFLKATIGAAAAPYIVPASALGAGDRPAPSNRLVMGFVGVGGQGTGDMGGFMGHKEVQVVAVCDVDKAHRDKAKNKVDEHYKDQGCAAVNDFREVVTRKDIDMIFCGTPDHWHALVTIEAMKNGKDVYCEKPESLTIREGRAMVETARRYGRVFSGGSQRVWEDYNWYHRMVRGGVIGEVKEAWVSVGGSSNEMLRPAQPAPEGMDWDMWIGPAPWRAYNKDYHPFNWRGCRDFSGGNMTDWGAHHNGGALFCMGLQYDAPVEVIPPDGKEYKYLTYKFANGIVMHDGGAWDGPMSFRGTKGEIPARDGKKGRKNVPAPNISIPNYKGSGGIFGDFLYCVKTRERPFRDIELAHRTLTVCHLGNIVTWLGQRLKYDPVKEEIIGNDEASRWLDRPKRAPWCI